MITITPFYLYRSRVSKNAREQRPSVITRLNYVLDNCQFDMKYHRLMSLHLMSRIATVNSNLVKTENSIHFIDYIRFYTLYATVVVKIVFLNKFICTDDGC